MVVLMVVLRVVLGLICVCTALLRWNEVKYRKKKGLPPSTMGWPLFGKTTEFLKQGPNFMKNQRARQKSMLDILDKCDIIALYGSTHKYMSGALLALDDQWNVPWDDRWDNRWDVRLVVRWDPPPT
ncbi:hypothetical protein HYC85_007329 [Camellia sinensis]|uniref:Uncharacterized protein n=1 Tax=Camellia sinensis TaxID=4442 RepID=A0A7J7HNM9_CAMSI|nr:hypothetical protein HYC85_007329 [Camellia sinensis]